MDTHGTATVMAAESDDPEMVGERLDQMLGPEYISYRKGPGGQRFAYMEGHELISMMNATFGWHRWTSKAMSFDTDYAEVGNGGKWSAGVAATVRLTVQVKGSAKEVFHEDIGYGTMDNAPSRGQAMEKCRKEAMTDGIKRAARQFGNVTGGCLYNKDYLEKIKTVKGPADRIEFNEDALCRKPVNKRKRFLMEQERKQRAMAVRTAPTLQDYMASDDDLDDEDMFATIPDSEELSL